MVTTTDAIVIGGGVIGTSLAYHLARAGLRVVLLEKKHLCAGGTGKSTAIVRMHYENEPETRLAWASFSTYAHFADVVGGDCGFTRTGVLWLVDHAEAEKLKANVTMHQWIGVNTRVVSPQEAKDIEPACTLERVALGAYEADSGYADPLLTTFAFAKRAREFGADLHEGVAVTGVLSNTSRVRGVRTDQGTIEAPVVINAAGCWAARLGRLVGLDIPITVQRNQIALLRQPRELLRRHCVVADITVGMYFRPEESIATMVGAGAGEDGVDPDTYNEAVDADFPPFARRKASERAPILERAVSRGGWSGIYDMTPDGKAILGQAGPEGFYLACGLSGTGFKKAPAIGQCLTELVTQGQSKTADLTPFRLSRFAEGQPLRGRYEYSDGGHFWQTQK
ncbi:MAG TPA: FAD-binding oxidoreductase [Candidatus Binatia bacterium]|nr:FAD-binding oxidoreductase [Candidatus Binatia bacterium]